MEHIIQFGINIDDESIKRTVMESGVKTIEAQIKQEIINKVFTAYRYRNANPASDPLSTWAQNLVADTLAENRDAIINQAAEIPCGKDGKEHESPRIGHCKDGRMRHVRIVAFPPVEPEWSVMPYFCKTEHKTGDIVKITPKECGELKYIFTDESHDVVYPAEGPIPEETDSFPAGKYYRVYCLDEISLLCSNIPLKLDGFVERYFDGAYIYENRKWGLLWW